MPAHKQAMSPVHVPCAGAVTSRQRHQTRQYATAACEESTHVHGIVVDLTAAAGMVSTRAEVGASARRQAWTQAVVDHQRPTEHGQMTQQSRF